MAHVTLLDVDQGHFYGSGIAVNQKIYVHGNLEFKDINFSILCIFITSVPTSSCSLLFPEDTKQKFISFLFSTN